MPYSKERKENITCERCGSVGKGFTLEWRNGWFRGDDEYENVCDKCWEKIANESEIERKKELERSIKHAEQQTKFWDGMKARLEAKYRVQYLTEYQWRINDEVDIYIVNRKYHILKSGKRGDYRDMFDFLRTYFK